MKLNQKDRAVALLAGNGAVTLQTMLFIGQAVFKELPRFETGLLMLCFAGIAAVALYGSWLAYQALGLAGAATKTTNVRCEAAISRSLAVLASNLGLGILAFSIVGGLVAFTSSSTG